MSELSRTILAGTGQIQDAFRTAITARADKRRRKQVALQSASEAFKGIGDTIKEYGDWRDAKVAEKDVRGIDEALALGLSTGGPDAALAAVNAIRPASAPGASRKADLVTRLSETVRKNLDDKLERAHEWEAEQRAEDLLRARLDFDRERHADRTETERAEVELEERKLRQKLAEERQERRENRKKERELSRKTSQFKKMVREGVATEADAWDASTIGGEVNTTLLGAALRTVKATKPADESGRTTRDQNDVISMWGSRAKKAESSYESLVKMSPDDIVEYDIDRGAGSYDSALQASHVDVLYSRMMVNLARMEAKLQPLYTDALKENMSPEMVRLVFERVKQGE